MIGTATGMIGGISNAISQSQVGKYEEAGQGLAAANASEQAAQDALVAQRRQRMSSGMAEAQAGALGLNGGSVLDVLNDMGNQSYQETQRILNQGNVQSQGDLLAGQAQAYSANQSAMNSGIGAFGSLIGGTMNSLYLRQMTTPRAFQAPTVNVTPKNPLFDNSDFIPIRS